MQELWDTKLLPFKDKFFKEKKDGVKLILEDSSYVHFDNYFAMKTFPEYQNCDVMDIKTGITGDR